LGATWRNPPDLLVLVAHVLLFPAPMKYSVGDTYGLIRIALGPSRKKLKGP
jgi:hypothetical protein